MSKLYPSYKPSGVEWIGEIPEHWETKRISHIADLLTGFAFKSELFSFSTGTKLVRGDNVTEGEVRWGDKTRYWKNPTEELDRFYLSEDDIVIGMDGSKVGKNYAMIEKTQLPLLLVQRVARIRSGSKALQKWIFRWIGSQFFRNHVDYVRTDPAIPHITLKDIGDFKITVPPHDELKAIVSYIAEKTAMIYEIIRKKKRLIELLQEERTALINQAVTRGLNPDVKLKPSGVEWLGDVPEHWEVKKLKYLLRGITGGGTPSTDKPEYWNGSIPWVSPKDMKVPVILRTEDYVTDLAVENSSTSLVAAGRVLVVVRSGILKHTLPLSINAVEVSLNQDMKALDAGDGISNAYLSCMLRGYSNLLLTYTKKIGATVDSIDMEAFLNFCVAVPPTCEQENILRSLRDKELEIERSSIRTSEECSLLEEYRTALINEVVTGKRCVVPVDEEAFV